MKRPPDELPCWVCLLTWFGVGLAYFVLLCAAYRLGAITKRLFQ